MASESTFQAQPPHHPAWQLAPPNFKQATYVTFNGLAGYFMYLCEAWRNKCRGQLCLTDTDSTLQRFSETVRCGLQGLRE